MSVCLLMAFTIASENDNKRVLSKVHDCLLRPNLLQICWYWPVRERKY